MRFSVIRGSLWLLACAVGMTFGAQGQTGNRAGVPGLRGLRVGVAQVDITPDYPVRLSGFGFRRTESEGVTQRIWAKALAFADEEEGPAILITTDNLGVPDEIVDEVAIRLSRRAGLKRHRVAITASHTHTAPMLSGVAPTLFGMPIPPEHQGNIDRYTREFIDKLEAVALAAVKEIRPARLEWAIGSVGFAINRRTQGGPVDHDLPVMVVREPDGKPRAIFFSYACHCVTLSHNHISGDWAGYAMERVQTQFPGAVALASVGCGADSNPSSGVTGDKTEVAAEQGKQIADEVERLLSRPLTAIRQGPTSQWKSIELALAAPRTRAEWEERAQRQDAVGHHARVNLGRLDAGQALPSHIDYPIQTWVFGEDLAMVFLPGEVVVDYSLLLKSLFDRERVWINAYANDAPCYIPSERVLQEGGYEGGDAMIYYDQPQKFAPGLEQQIIDVIKAQMPAAYRAAEGTEGSNPKTPERSMGSIWTKPGLELELVAAEPQITSPVAIDWGPDGRLWVCEMFDYPTGADGDWQPGGRVRFLEDTDGDGAYDRSTVFLEGVPFPTGVTAWGKGVLVCAAPDILWAKDTDGDGRADQVDKLYSGFVAENYQARVNSLSLGLDNWIYGANGLLGGVITRERVDIRGHDFRFRTLRGPLEIVSGLTQQGRVRDDWGHWYGCDNGNALFYFPYEHRYLQRNPHIPAPAAVISPRADFDVGRVYPISRLLARFNDPDQANRLTSGCGLGLYRDVWLGEQYYGNSFTCEPVHNLVHRLILEEDGRVRRRAPDEQQSEFLASTDHWFRPVQVRTGPDGALYVVDMYRFLIEHPRWIPAGRLAQLDVRAGSDRGRIYRVLAKGKALRPIRDLSVLSTEQLAAALETPNGTERDRLHLELLHRQDPAGSEVLVRQARTSRIPQVRVQALSVLAGLKALTVQTLVAALSDSDDRVRTHALRLSEGMAWDEGLASVVLALTRDPSPRVRVQLAFTLGEWRDPRAALALSELATHHLAEPDLRAAILSSAPGSASQLLAAVRAVNAPVDWVMPLAATVAGSGDEQQVAAALRPMLSAEPGPDTFRIVASLLDALDRRGKSWSPEFAAQHDLTEMGNLFSAARRGLASADEQEREAAMLLLSHGPDVEPLYALVSTEPSDRVRAALFTALRRQRSPAVAGLLLRDWGKLFPGPRSQVLGLLLEREPWAEALLEAVEDGRVPARDIPLSARRRFLQSEDAKVRRRAGGLWGEHSGGDRARVVERYHVALSLSGDAARGAEVFAQQCAVCHALRGLGHEVGPDLEALRIKEPAYWLQNILDPNAVVEPRFVNYEVETRDDRILSGVIRDETATTLSVIAGNGAVEQLLRSEIKAMRALTLSLMPEGLEEGIPPQAMADLIAYLRWPAPAPPPDGLLRDPVAIARFLLDETHPNDGREAVIRANPQFATRFIAEMVRDIEPINEYERIPWLWRVALACGRRNDANELGKAVAVSLPPLDGPLRDWQAVVIGGGIINGLSQRGIKPGPRLEQILKGQPELAERWQRTLDLASVMADDQTIPSGTRYDALRMLGVEPWAKCHEQLSRHLGDQADPELQMGAVSALLDMQPPEAIRTLVASLNLLTEHNGRLALEALLRDKNALPVLREHRSSMGVNARRLLNAMTQHEDAIVSQRATMILHFRQ